MPGQYTCSRCGCLFTRPIRRNRPNLFCLRYCYNGSISNNDPNRFWAKVDRAAGPSGCWIWMAARDEHQYGKFYLNGRLQKSSRVAWESANGPIPDGRNVLHHCDNPPCVNPAHLFLGTQSDNTADMIAKGRARPTAPRGEASSLSRLTEAEVRVIRSLWSFRTITQRDLATRYGVSRLTIWRILHRKIWTHI